MAKQTQTQTQTQTDNDVIRAPEGFRRVGAVSNAPWFNLRKGNQLIGILENVYTRNDERAKDGESKFFQIRLEQETEGREGRGEEAQVVMIPAGKIVNVNYGPKTKGLEKYVDSVLAGAVIRVWVGVVGDKFKIGKGKFMWDIDVQVNIVKPAPESTEGSSDDFEGDEVF